MKNQIKLIFTTLTFFIFTNISFSANEDNIYDKIDLFGEVLDKINKEYVEDINQSDAMDAAINGVLQSLDPYSGYMSPEVFKEMQTETSGKFGGLGIEVGMEAGVVKVISPIDNTPASRAGIKAGDYIVKINETQVQGKSLTEAVDLMRGPVGSNIEITVRRVGEKKAIIFNITREIIKIESVKSKIIDNKTGYILDNEKEFADAIVRLLENDSLWKEMHLNCLKYQRNWGWRDAAKKFESIIN